MEKKNVVFLTIIAVATLLTAVIGATFAYFSVSVGGTGNETNNTTTVKTAVIAGVDYEGTSVAEVPEDGAYPGWKGVQVFTIAVPDGTPTDAKGTYIINLTPNVDPAFGTDVTYEVYKTTTPASQSITRTEGTISNNVVDGVSQISREDSLTFTGFTETDDAIAKGTLSGTTVIELEEVDYTGALAETTYYVVYKYANTNADQNAAMGKTFSAKVTVDVEIQDYSTTTGA